MAAFTETMKQASEYLTNKFNKNVSDAFLSYIEDEEIEEIDVITNDINSDVATSSIVEFVSDKFSWNDTQKEDFFSTLRIFFELDTNPIHITPNDIDWTNFSDNDLKETRQYINGQCFNAFSALDQSFITLETIGRNHNINIVPLLFDIYSFYKYSNLKQNNDVTHSEFCKKSQILNSLSKKDNTKKIYSSLVQTLASFEYRMIPKFNIHSSLKIVDNINAYIKYTLYVAQMLNGIILNNHSCLPLLVDFWIIPPMIKDSMNSNIDDDDDDSDDSDDDSDEEEIKQDTITQNFDENLKKYQVDYCMNSVDCNNAANCIRTLKLSFEKILNKCRRSIKICMIIDRRKEKNNLLVYQLPLKYSAIPRNYCDETLIYSSSEHLMFDIDNSILKQKRKQIDANKDKDPIFGAKFDCDGKMFCLSFSLLETNKNRIQFWRHGGGMRFWPQYMLSVWPQLFLNPKIDKQYLEKDFIKNNFKLNVSDQLFDGWYKSIVNF